MTASHIAGIEDSNIVKLRVRNPVNVNGPLNGIISIHPSIETTEKIKLEFRGICSTRFEPENIVRDPRFPVKVSELRQLILTEQVIHVPSDHNNTTSHVEVPFSIALPHEVLLPLSLSLPDDQAKIFYTVRAQVSKRRKGPLLLSKKFSCVQKVQLCPEVVRGDIKERDITVDIGNNSQIRVLVPVKLVPSTQPHRLRVLTPESRVLENLTISLREVTTLFAQHHSAVYEKHTITIEKDSFLERTHSDTSQKSYLITFYVDSKSVQQSIESPLITRNHLLRLNFKFSVSSEGGGVGFNDNTVFDMPILVQGRRLSAPSFRQAPGGDRRRPMSIASGLELASQRLPLHRTKTSSPLDKRLRPCSLDDSQLSEPEFPLTPVTPNFDHPDRLKSESLQLGPRPRRDFELPPSPRSPPLSLTSRPRGRSSVVSVMSESSWISLPVVKSSLVECATPILDWEWRDVIDGIYIAETDSEED